MTREDIKKHIEGVTDEQINALLDIHSADIGKVKRDYDTIKLENNTLKKDKEGLENKISELSEKSSSADDYKKQLEDLQKQIKEEKEQAEADRLAKEKAAAIATRFDTVVGEKKFAHDAIRADYLAKFTEAVGNEANAGKSDSDIFTQLTKDDAGAFENVVAYKLEGGRPGFDGEAIDDAKAREIMGLPPLKN